MVEIDLDYVIKQKYIECEVLDKIRAEIEQLREDYKAYWEMEEANALDNALTIIDKYRAESEDV